MMKGNGSSLGFRAFALCVAIGLGGAYVWFQQRGAAGSEKVETPVMPGSKSRVMTMEPGVVIPLEQLTGAEEPVVMPGSKGGIFRLKPGETEQVVMPGSKSFKIMPGSKSIAPLLSIPETKEELPEP